MVGVGIWRPLDGCCYFHGASFGYCYFLGAFEGGLLLIAGCLRMVDVISW